MPERSTEEPRSDSVNRDRRSHHKKLGFAILALTVLGLFLAEVTEITSFYSKAGEWVASNRGADNDYLTIVGVHQQERDDASFLNGLRMAVDQINEDANGILGRTLKLALIAEKPVSVETALEETVKRSLEVAEQATQQKNLLGVVGHEATDTAVPASSIYGRNSVLFLATQATGRVLTDRGFQTVFAMQPNNSINAQMIARYAIQQKSKRFLVLADKSDYARESANFFTAAISGNGGEVVFRGHLGDQLRSTDQLLLFILDNKLFQRSDFDAFFVVSATSAATVEFIKRARTLGLNEPIYGMEYLFSDAIEKAVGKEAMRGVAGVSLYDRDAASARAGEFFMEYEKRFGQRPDLQSAIGYDAVSLIKDAVTRAGTADPKKISDILKISRYKEPFSGVTGRLAFDQQGQITDTQVFVVAHDGNDFSTVASYQIPISWATSTKANSEDQSDGASSTDMVPSPDEEAVSQ